MIATLKNRETMQLTPNISNYTGANKETGGVNQLNWFDTESGISIILTLEIKNHPKWCKSISKEILSSLKKYIIEHPSGTTEENFEEALKDINSHLQTHLNEVGRDNEFHVNAVIAVLQNNEMYVTQTGDAEVYLVRKGKFTIIGESTKSYDDEFFVNIAAGEVRDKDSLLFSSSRLLRFLTPNQLGVMFKEGANDQITAFREAAYANDSFPAAITFFDMEGSKDSAEESSVSFSSFLQPLKNLFEKNASQFQRNKSMAFAGIIIVTIVLVSTISILNSQQIETQQIGEIKNNLQHIADELKRAENLNIQGKKVEAGNILHRVASDVKDILDTGEFRKEAISLNGQIEDQKSAIYDIERISNPQIVTDVSDINAVGLIRQGSNLYAYSNALYEIILNIVEKQAINISQDVAIISGVSMPDKTMYFYGADGRIREIDLTTGTSSLPDTEDSTWKKGIALASYGDRFLYVFSPDDNQIYKYAKRRTDFGRVVEYVTDGSKVTGPSIDISDDGYVWTLKPSDEEGKNVEVVKHYAGELVDFNVEGLPTNIMPRADKIIAGLNNLYICDYKGSTITVIRRTTDLHPPRYKKQIVLENAGQMRDIDVSPNEEYISALTDSSIVRINL